MESLFFSPICALYQTESIDFSKGYLMNYPLLIRANDSVVLITYYCNPKFSEVKGSGRFIHKLFLIQYTYIIVCLVWRSRKNDPILVQQCRNIWWYLFAEAGAGVSKRYIRAAVTAEALKIGRRYNRWEYFNSTDFAFDSTEIWGGAHRPVPPALDRSRSIWVWII